MLRKALSTTTARLSSTMPATLPQQAPVLRHLSAAVEILTPLSLAERSWDNVGLLIEAPKPRQPTGPQQVFCCIDLTTAVANEALSSPSTTAILCYHPPIFSGLKSLTLSTPLQRSLLNCVAEGVSIFCIHTAADNALNGVNDFMGQALLKEVKGGVGLIEAIEVKENAPSGHEGAGSGRIVKLGEEGLSKDQVVKAVKGVLGLQYLQAAWADDGAETIKTVAICAGSGSGVLKGVQADLYLTGEFGHHDTLAANAKGIHALVCNHSATERPWLAEFAPRLAKEMNTAAGTTGAYEVVVSKTDREPLVVV